jgi:hypothetical protein
MATTYEPLNTTTLNSNQTTVSFTGFSADYTDLVISCNFANTTSVDMILRFNSDSSTNYSYMSFAGNGSGRPAVRGYNTNAIVLDPAALGFGTSRSSGVINVMSYASTTIAKTTVNRFNAPGVTTGISIGTWRSTSAITTIDITASTSSTIVSGSTFTLYGIKAA